MKSPTHSFKDLTSPTSFTFPSLNARPDNTAQNDNNNNRTGGTIAGFYNAQQASTSTSSAGYHTSAHPGYPQYPPPANPDPSLASYPYTPSYRTSGQRPRSPSSFSHTAGYPATATYYPEAGQRAGVQEGLVGYGYGGGYPDTTSGLFTPLQREATGMFPSVSDMGGQGIEGYAGPGPGTRTGNDGLGQHGRLAGRDGSMERATAGTGQGKGPFSLGQGGQGYLPPPPQQYGQYFQPMPPDPPDAQDSREALPPRLSFIHGRPNVLPQSARPGFGVSPEAIAAAVMNKSGRSSSRSPDGYARNSVNNTVHAGPGSSSSSSVTFGMGGLTLSQLGLNMNLGIPPAALQGMSKDQAVRMLPQSGYQGGPGIGQGQDGMGNHDIVMGGHGFGQGIPLLRPQDEALERILTGSRGDLQSLPLQQHIANTQGPADPMEARQPNARPGKRGLDGGLAGTGLGSSDSGEGGERTRSEREIRGREAEDKEEDVTTIFIIGLPDDLSEREFVNMFTFAPGFEAAMLKVPTAGRATALRTSHGSISGNVDDASATAATSDLPDMALSKVRSTESVDEGSLNPSSSSASLIDGSTSSYPLARTTSGLIATVRRGGVLGFARFASRADALVARDILQGRRVDPMAASGLKVEMAKKNLHSKRSIGNEELVSMLVRSGKLPGILAGIGLAGAQLAPNSSTPGTAYISRSGTPSTKHGTKPSASGLSNGDAADDLGKQRRSGTEPGRNGSADRNGQRDTAERRRARTYSDQPIGAARSSQGTGTNRRDLDTDVAAVGPALSKSIDSKALLALAEEADGSEDWNVVGRGMDNLGAFDNESRMPSPYPQMQQSGWSGQPVLAGFGGESTLQPLLSHRHDSYSRYLGEGKAEPGIGPLNLADQNPPINTLYVGNLPPSEGFLEDALRALFMQAPGFRRMSFRQKVNGPMCFVEFDDIPLATQAMKELYAHTLGGMVKGGLRLAYSRNPLGQRGGYSGGAGPRRMNGLAPLTSFSSIQGYRAPGMPTSEPHPGLYHGHGSYTGTSPPSDRPYRSSRRPSEQSAGLSPHATPFSSSLNHHLAMSPASHSSGLHDVTSSSSPRGPAMTPWVSAGGAEGTVAGGMSTLSSVSGSLGRKSLESPSAHLGMESVQTMQPIFPSTNFGDMD